MQFQIPPVKRHTPQIPSIQMQPANLGVMSSLQPTYVNPIVIGSIFQRIYQPAGSCSSCGR